MTASQRIVDKRADYGDAVLFRAFGEPYNTYRQKWKQACGRELVTEFPLYLQFELTPHCNLACPSCIHGVETLKSGYVKVPNTLDFGKVIEEAASYGCPSIAFHNNNEPLLVRDVEDKIKMARSAGFIDLIMTTNATLLNAERAERLLDAGLTKINFSIDALTEETYRVNRKNGDFKTVTSNIMAFLDLKKRKNYELPITRATFVINRNNYQEADGFREYWKDKVDLVEFQNFQAIEGYTEPLCPPGFEKFDGFECSYPWQQVVIRANGDVLPCCSFYGADIVLGNVARNSIHELWHGPVMTALRETLSKGIFAHLSCAKCAGTFYKKK